VAHLRSNCFLTYLRSTARTSGPSPSTRLGGGDDLPCPLSGVGQRHGRIGAERDGFLCLLTRAVAQQPLAAALWVTCRACTHAEGKPGHCGVGVDRSARQRGLTAGQERSVSFTVIVFPSC
jgi:hypothetical protein